MNHNLSEIKATNWSSIYIMIYHPQLLIAFMIGHDTADKFDFLWMKFSIIFIRLMAIHIWLEWSSNAESRTSAVVMQTFPLNTAIDWLTDSYALCSATFYNSFILEETKWKFSKKKRQEAIIPLESSKFVICNKTTWSNQNTKQNSKCCHHTTTNEIRKESTLKP